MATEIIIGREQKTRRLSVSKDGNTKVIGMPNSVPMDVSRQHVMLRNIGGEKWEIKNLNDLNVTYVNEMDVESKEISESDKIELGKSRFPVSWEIIRGPKVDIVDIRPLKKVWDDYNEKRLGCQIAERKFNVARSAAGIITMLAIVSSFVVGHGPIYLVLYGVAISVSVIFAIQAYSKCSEVPRLQQDLQDSFDSMWICPKCGHPLSAKSYTILSKLDSCPYCKAKYKK